MTPTHEDFLAAGPDGRVELAERLLVALIQQTRPGEPAWFDGSTQLSALSIDSIQLVELKFALDQFAGVELDIEMFIVNPTVHELARSIAATGQ